MRISHELAYMTVPLRSGLPNQSAELLLIARDVATELLFHTTHGGNWILECILPGFQALGVWPLRRHGGNGKWDTGVKWTAGREEDNNSKVTVIVGA